MVGKPASKPTQESRHLGLLWSSFFIYVDMKVIHHCWVLLFRWTGLWILENKLLIFVSSHLTSLHLLFLFLVRETFFAWRIMGRFDSWRSSIVAPAVFSRTAQVGTKIFCYPFRISRISCIMHIHIYQHAYTHQKKPHSDTYFKHLGKEFCTEYIMELLTFIVLVDIWYKAHVVLPALGLCKITCRLASISLMLSIMWLFKNPSVRISLFYKQSNDV